jgi:hypothetical protein
MRPVPIAALFITLAMPATADISWKADRIAPGSVLVLESDDGAVFTHMKRGAEGGEIRFDTFAGESVAGRYVGSYLTTSSGEITKTISATGAVTQFLPHRCMRTVGECRYTIVQADGSREGRVRVTRETTDGLAWQEYAAGQLVQTGALALDEMGSTKAGWSENAQSGKRTKTRRLLVSYR